MCDGKRLFMAMPRIMVLLQPCLATVTSLVFDFLFTVSDVLTKDGTILYTIKLTKLRTGIGSSFCRSIRRYDGQ